MDKIYSDLLSVDRPSFSEIIDQICKKYESISPSDTIVSTTRGTASYIGKVSKFLSIQEDDSDISSASGTDMSYEYAPSATGLPDKGEDFIKLNIGAFRGCDEDSSHETLDLFSPCANFPSPGTQVRKKGKKLPIDWDNMSVLSVSHFKGIANICRAVKQLSESSSSNSNDTFDDFSEQVFSDMPDDKKMNVTDTNIPGDLKNDFWSTPNRVNTLTSPYSGKINKKMNVTGANTPGDLKNDFWSTPNRVNTLASPYSGKIQSNINSIPHKRMENSSHRKKQHSKLVLEKQSSLMHNANASFYEVGTSAGNAEDPLKIESIRSMDSSASEKVTKNSKGSLTSSIVCKNVFPNQERFQSPSKLLSSPMRRMNLARSSPCSIAGRPNDNSLNFSNQSFSSSSAVKALIVNVTKTARKQSERLNCMPVKAQKNSPVTLNSPITNNSFSNEENKFRNVAGTVPFQSNKVVIHQDLTKFNVMSSLRTEIPENNHIHGLSSVRKNINEQLLNSDNKGLLFPQTQKKLTNNTQILVGEKNHQSSQVLLPLYKTNNSHSLHELLSRKDAPEPTNNAHCDNFQFMKVPNGQASISQKEIDMDEVNRTLKELHFSQTAKDRPKPQKRLVVDTSFSETMIFPRNAVRESNHNLEFVGSAKSDKNANTQVRIQKSDTEQYPALKKSIVTNSTPSNINRKQRAQIDLDGTNDRDNSLGIIDTTKPTNNVHGHSSRMKSHRQSKSSNISHQCSQEAERFVCTSSIDETECSLITLTKYQKAKGEKRQLSHIQNLRKAVENNASHCTPKTATSSIKKTDYENCIKTKGNWSDSRMSKGYGSSRAHSTLSSLSEKENLHSIDSGRFSADKSDLRSPTTPKKHRGKSTNIARCAPEREQVGMILRSNSGMKLRSGRTKHLF